MNGNELKTLMRLHKVTIRDLAKRTQITQKRIRLRRETGLGPEIARDWIQAITGTDPGPQTMKTTS